MAEKKTEKVENVEKTPQPERDMAHELVDFFAFKDSDKYKDDVVVAVNGKVWRIQRGVHVQIPRYVYWAIEDSRRQDVAAASMIDRETAAYKAAMDRLT